MLKKGPEEQSKNKPFEPKDGIIKCEQAFYLFSK